MPIEVIKKRENHIRPPEIGRMTCQGCGSELRAMRHDFSRGRRPDSVGVANCPVCGKLITESELLWAPFDANLEKRAREMFYQSQSHLHNLQTMSWEEVSEETREAWRGRVR